MLLLVQSTCQPLLPVLAAPLVLNPSEEVSCNVCIGFSDLSCKR